MDRRSFMALAGCCVAGVSHAARETSGSFVNADWGSLKRVIVHRPLVGDLGTIPDFADHDEAALRGDDQLRGSQHDQFVSMLQAANVEVLTIESLLDEAILRCQAAGRLSNWIAYSAPWLIDSDEEINANLLLATAGTSLDGLLDDQVVIPVPVRSMFFTRDIAVATPRGLILCRFANQDRAPELNLLRFMLQWSPRLRKYPIVFDGDKSNTFIQGGDMMMLNKKTLLMGVGNLSDRSAAPKLAKALNLDVIAVQLPGQMGRKPGSVSIDSWNSLRTRFLHLDTVFTLLSEKKFLTIPYVFESQYSDRNTIRDLAFAFQSPDEDEEAGFALTARNLAELGKVKKYVAGTGAIAQTGDGMKLVDYLRSQGYSPCFVGGTPSPKIDIESLRDVVIPEMERQAANVVALKPGRVIAYSGNDHTLAALKKTDVDVTLFSGSALGRWHGGPHCLTLPLERV